jgi:hypothetical protein
MNEFLNPTGSRLAVLMVFAAAIAGAAALAEGGDVVRATIDCPSNGDLINVEAPILSGTTSSGKH